MEKTKLNDKLLLEFSGIFLKVSKQLQNVHLLENKNNEWDNLFHYALQQLKVVYGYFTEYEPGQDKIKYFIKSNSLLENLTDKDFKPPVIPYFPNENGDNYKLYNKLLLPGGRGQEKFDDIIHSPKLYQHLPLQPIGEAKQQLVSDKCLNCYIPCEIKSKNDYYVVLFDEIAFYQYAYCHLVKKDVYKYYIENKPLFLKYLLKFATSIDSKINNQKLSEQLGLSPDNWKTNDENVIRKQIEKIVDDNFLSEEWIKAIEATLNGLVNKFIEYCKKEEIYKSRDLKPEEILKHISRFDVEASFELLDANQKPILHDVFVFPLYTESTPVFKTTCVHDKVELPVYSPLLLVLYIKTIYEIERELGETSPQLDENEGSIDGFQLTKEIAKLFADKIIQEDYIKNIIRKDTKKAAIKAAISQVQSRNGSHNIGSHVMNKLTGDLSAIKLSEFINYKSVYSSKQISDLLKQIAIFNNYIKCRMDYLSDISFGIPAMQITKRLQSEVISGLDDVRLLLENISGLSDFKYSIRVECDFDKDPSIAMPNDILGCQAFYNILENIIRNTAKHGNKANIDDPEHTNQEDKVVQFTIELREVLNDKTDNCPETVKNQINELYEVTIYDNILIPCKKDFSEEPELKADYLETTGKTDKDIRVLSNLEYLVYRQNKKLNESILKEDNTLRSTNLGLIEIEASACYLRKMDISNMEDDNYQISYDEHPHNGKNLNILKAVAAKGKYLGYRFFVLKPAEVLLVGDYEVNDNLKNNGFSCLSYNDFEQEVRSGKVFTHQFLIYEDEKLIEVINEKEKTDSDIEVFKYKSLIPKRELKIVSSIFNLKEKNPETLLAFIWEEWSENVALNDLEIKKGIPEHPDSPHFVLLNHGPSALRGADIECLKKWFDDENNDNYIEALSSSGQGKLPEFSGCNSLTEYINMVEEPENSYLYYQLLESMRQKIVVIDERVQHAGYTYESEGYKFYKYYKHSNIIIPPDSINLGANNLGDITNKILEFINKHIDNNSFLIVHYSILERFYSNSNNKQNEINKWLNKYSSRTNVVVTSGRGIPPDLPPSVCFVNLSPVLAALIEFRSKYYLHQVVMSSRKSYKL